MNTVAERWPLFAMLHAGALRNELGCVWISTSHDFKMHQRDDLVWFSRAGRAIIWGAFDELGVEWLDQFEAQLARVFAAPLRHRGGKFPFAAAILGLAREGASYFTAVERYNSNKARPKALLERIETNCVHAAAYINAIYAALPQPIAEELAPAFIYMLADGRITTQ